MTYASGLQQSAARRLSVFANFRAVFVGRLVSATSLWLALVFLAHLSDPATVGRYALAQAICIPIAEVLKMGLREVRSSDVVTPRPYQDYFRLRIVCALVALVLIPSVASFVAETRATLLVIAIYGMSRVVEMVSDMIYGQFQARERMTHIGKSQMLVGVLSLVFLVVGYVMTGSLIIAVLGQLLAYSIVLLFYDLPALQRLDPGSLPGRFAGQWFSHSITGLARIAMPLALANVFLFISLTAPRLVLESYLGLAALGLFAPILALAMAPERLVQAFGVALSVRLANAYAHGASADFAKLLGTITVALLALCALGTVIVWMTASDILGLIYPEVYAEQANLLVVLTIALSLRLLSNVFKFGLIAARQFRWLMVRSIVTAAAALPICFALIPAHGLIGAAYAIVLITVVQFATSAIGIGWMFQKKTNRSAP